MFCKRCGYEIKKEWKYCPNCSEKTYKENRKEITIVLTCILLSILITILSIILIPIISNIDFKYDSIKSKGVMNFLKKKYNEDFSNCHLVKSEQNYFNLDCDGSSLGKIRDEGKTKYYKIYSPKNDIEFFAYYDTSDENKKIHDTYMAFLERKKTIKKAYSLINEEFYNDNNKMMILFRDEESNKHIITFDAQLDQLLSVFDDSWLGEKGKSPKGGLNYFKEDFYIYINQDLTDFCSTNYEKIINLYNVINPLQKKYSSSSLMRSFRICLVFNNEYEIYLDDLTKLDNLEKTIRNKIK